MRAYGRDVLGQVAAQVRVEGAAHRFVPNRGDHTGI